MVKKIQGPTVIKAAGNLPKIIEEYVGRVNSQTGALSIARMKSPAGWIEPGQTVAAFEAAVLAGALCVETGSQSFRIDAGQAVIVEAGQWVQYSTPGSEGAEYIAVCLPAFSPEIVHRDEA